MVVSDISIDRVSGSTVGCAKRRADADTSVIIMTARGSVRTTVEAEIQGAFEYLAKPFELRRLAEAIERSRKVRESPPPEAEEALDQFGGIIGFSPPMVEVYRCIARFANSDDTVLIVGESGTGKELVAHAVHDNSQRAAKPFLPIDCGAVPPQLW